MCASIQVLSFDIPPGCDDGQGVYDAEHGNEALSTTQYTCRGGAFGLAVFALWDDTCILAGRSQGIYYQVDGTIITFEFSFSRPQDAAQYYHYLIIYDSNQPGVWTIKYLEVSDQGTSATVGVQGGKTPLLCSGDHSLT